MNKFTNNNFKIMSYLFIFQNLRSVITNIVLVLKGQWFLRRLIDHKNQSLDINDINRKIDKLTKSIKVKRKKKKKRKVVKAKTTIN